MAATHSTVVTAIIAMRSMVLGQRCIRPPVMVRRTRSPQAACVRSRGTSPGRMKNDLTIMGWGADLLRVGRTSYLGAGELVSGGVMGIRRA